MAHKKTPAAGGAAGAGMQSADAGSCASRVGAATVHPAADRQLVLQRVGRIRPGTSSRRFACSGRGNPCPICGRTKDGDCRWGDDWIACHSGAAANSLKPGQTIEAEGCTWYLSRTGGGHSGMAHIYRPHRPGQHQKNRHRAKVGTDMLAKVRVCRRFYAALRPRVHAALRLPLWEQCSPVELRLVAETFDAAQQLIHHLQQARRLDQGLARLLPIVCHWVKALGYQLADLQTFQRHQLGMQEGWR
jgi:hypothetical protein